MIEREKFELDEKRRRCYARDHYTCICGKSINYYNRPSLAHRVPQTEENVERYGKAVVHHEINLRSVCSLKCNKKVDIGTKPIAVSNLVSFIKKKIARG